MQLGLGTVQFGLPYGVTNHRGQCPVEEVQEILQMAQASGIALFDTAATYGDSEEILGQYLPPSQQTRIVTKTPRLPARPVDDASISNLKEAFTRSLHKLKRGSIYALLLHNCDDALAENSHRVIDCLTELREAGLVEKIGVSVYEATQIDRILENFAIDIIQVPFSVLDQRLEDSGHLNSLNKAGVVIQARSIFLQGLVLEDPEKLHPYFEPVRSLLRHFHDVAAAAGLNATSAALQFIRRNRHIDQVLVGVTCASELDEILTAWSQAMNWDMDFKDFAVSDERIANPSLWPTLAQSA